MAEAPQDIFSPTTPIPSNGRRVVILTANKVQDLELFYPYYRLCEEGFQVDIATPKGGPLKCESGMKLEHTFSVNGLSPHLYEMVLIPGGKAPAVVRQDAACVKFVQAFAGSARPVAAFCHGPQVLISAGMARGVNLAAWPGIEYEITKAGGIYVNQPAVEDGQFITGRWPGDLPAFMQVVMRRLLQPNLKVMPRSMLGAMA